MSYSHFMQNPKIILFGSNGQVGHFLKKELEHFDLYIPQREQSDFQNTSSILDVLSNFTPDIVVNAAAYTDVRKAEEEPQKAELVNAQTPQAIALWCQQNKKKFISYSTDYVFGSNDDHIQTEDEETHPLNAYGKSKAHGDKLIQTVGGDYFIFRTSWVYSEVGNNFLKTMFKLCALKEEISVVNDQTGAPTYAYDLANMTAYIINKMVLGKTFKPGIYNACNSGVATWYDFSLAILDYVKSKKSSSCMLKKVIPVSTNKYNQIHNSLLQRPLNSRLSLDKIKSEFAVEFRHWKEALLECLTKVK